MCIEFNSWTNILLGTLRSHPVYYGYAHLLLSINPSKWLHVRLIISEESTSLLVIPFHWRLLSVRPFKSPKDGVDQEGNPRVPKDRRGGWVWSGASRTGRGLQASQLALAPCPVFIASQCCQCPIVRNTRVGTKLGTLSVVYPGERFLRILDFNMR